MPINGFVLLIMASLLSGCIVRPGVHPDLSHKTPPFQGKPGEELEHENNVWTFVETVTNGSENNYEACDGFFELGGACETRAKRCHRKNNIYACFPDDQLVRVYGIVVDETGQPLPGARVMGGLGFPGYTNINETVTNARGEFMVKAGFCLNVVYASLDGYASPWDYFVSSMTTLCRVEDYIGAKDVKVTLKKIARTVSPAHEPVQESGKCNIVGRVVDEKGQPLEGAEAAVNLGEPTYVGYKATTDASGEYSISYTGKCPDLVEAAKPGYSNPRSWGRATCIKGVPGDIVLEKNK